MAAATIPMVVRRHFYFYTILTNHNSALQFSQSDSQAEDRLLFPKSQHSEPLLKKILYPGDVTVRSSRSREAWTPLMPRL
jgi:hypothetical protein